jgi:hypothetical protein
VINQDLNNKFLQLTALCTLMAVMCGCAHAETPGERFREIMANIDKECRERQLGPYEPEPRKTGIRNSSCDILFLKPYDPLATPEGRFAHSIKLPPPHDKPQDVYKPGMTSEEYFKALCEAEAGEFIFKKVENVEGVLQMRPYQGEPDLLGQFFAYEGIAGLSLAMYDRPQGFMVGDRRRYYSYFEVLVANSGSQSKYERWRPVVRKQDEKQAIASRNVTLINQKDVIEAPSARYGYTQRSIPRPNDREHGIRGAELIIIDIKRNEVLAFRRVFRRYFFDPNYLTQRQVFGQGCPTGQNGFEFIQNVLKPINQN